MNMQQHRSQKKELRKRESSGDDVSTRLRKRANGIAVKPASTKKKRQTKFKGELVTENGCIPAESPANHRKNEHVQVPGTTRYMRSHQPRACPCCGQYIGHLQI